MNTLKSIEQSSKTIQEILSTQQLKRETINFRNSEIEDQINKNSGKKILSLNVRILILNNYRGK